MVLPLPGGEANKEMRLLLLGGVEEALENFTLTLEGKSAEPSKAVPITSVKSY